MKTMQNTSRRQFMRVVSAWFVGTVFASRAAGAPATDPIIVRLSRLFADRNSARRIGDGFLAGRPGEADPYRLGHLLAGTAEKYHQIQQLDEAGLRHFVSTQQQRDFKAGRLVSVDGWLLSLTEARLCATVSLTHG